MRIMILSSAPWTNTGYARIVENLYTELNKIGGYDIAVTGLQQVTRIENYRGCTIYPAMGNFHEGDIKWQKHRLKENMKYHNSDILLCIFQGDNPGYREFTEIIPDKTVWYMPIEGEIIYPKHDLFEAARKVKKVIAMTNSAGDQFKKRGIPHEVVYLGHNPKIFKRNYNKGLNEPVMVYFPDVNEQHIIPASELLKIKEKLGVECMFGFVAENFGIKKRLERLIEAFSIFSKGKSDVHLHLHTNPIAAKGIELPQLIECYNLEKNKISFSYGTYTSSGWSEVALNILYNTFDVYVTASSGGGFELPNFETASLGIPQLCPNFMPFNELYPDGERSLLCKCIPQMTQIGENRALVLVDDMVKKMQIMYEDKNLRKLLGDNCAKWASQYTWQAAAKRFDMILRSM